MIELKVEEYCRNCPEFEPDVNRTDVAIYNRDPVLERLVNTTITCVHRIRCESMYKSIESAKTKSKEKKK